MTEYDFLTPFEEELEELGEGRADEAECELFAPMLEMARQHMDEYKRRVTTMKDPEKKRRFEELLPLLLHLAEGNCACLRIFDEDETIIRVELEFLDLLGGTGKDSVYGEILSKLFDYYRDFWMGITPDHHIILKFNVPLVDEVIIAGCAMR